MRYASAAAFRTALEQRLLNQSRETGTSLVRLRKTVVFDRLLARLMEVATVFLWEDSDVLYRRTRGPGRPLRGLNFEDFARRYAERLPYYLEVASLQIEPHNRSPHLIASEIIEWLRNA